MNKLSEQIEKYQEQLKNMIIMDDYDGGEANQLRKVIDDLRELEGTKFTVAQFIEEARTIHGDKYDYSKVEPSWCKVARKAVRKKR